MGRGKEKIFEDRGRRVAQVERGGREDPWFGEIVKEEKELQRKERWERSNESKYNRWYREVQGEEIP